MVDLLLFAAVAVALLIVAAMVVMGVVGGLSNIAWKMAEGLRGKDGESWYRRPAWAAFWVFLAMMLALAFGPGTGGH